MLRVCLTAVHYPLIRKVIFGPLFRIYTVHFSKLHSLHTLVLYLAIRGGTCFVSNQHTIIAIHFDSCSPRTDTDFRTFDTLGRTRIAIIPQPCSARQNNLFSLDLSFGPPPQAMASFRLSPFCVTHRNECHRRGERIRLICFRALRSNLSLRVRKRSAATNGLVPHESTTTTAAFPKLCFGPSNTNKPGKARSLCMGETVFHPPTHRLRCDS